MPRSALQNTSGFQSPLFFDTLQSWGEQVWDKKRNNVLDKEINMNLTEELSFRGSRFQAYKVLLFFQSPEVSLKEGVTSQGFPAF